MENENPKCDGVERKNVMLVCKLFDFQKTCRRRN